MTDRLFLIEELRSVKQLLILVHILNETIFFTSAILSDIFLFHFSIYLQLKLYMLLKPLRCPVLYRYFATPFFSPRIRILKICEICFFFCWSRFQDFEDFCPIPPPPPTLFHEVSGHSLSFISNLNINMTSILYHVVGGKSHRDTGIFTVWKY